MSDDGREHGRKEGGANLAVLGCAELTDHIVSYFIARDAFDDRPILKAAVKQHLESCPDCASKGHSLRSALAAMNRPSSEKTAWAWNVLREAARREAETAG